MKKYAIGTSQSRVTVSDHTLHTMRQLRVGGVLWADRSRGSLISNETMFANNMARVGGVMVMDRATVNGHASRFTNNQVNFSLLYMTESTVHWSGVTFLAMTNGSLQTLLYLWCTAEPEERQQRCGIVVVVRRWSCPAHTGNEVTCCMGSVEEWL